MSNLVILLCMTLLETSGITCLPTPNKPSDLEGAIRKVLTTDLTSGFVGEIYVAPVETSDTPGPLRFRENYQVRIRITSDTQIFKSSTETVDFGYLTAGQLVEIRYHTGSSETFLSPPVAEVVVLEPIRVGMKVQESKLIRRTVPVYPPEAREQGIEGSVLLQVEVNPEGRVAAVSRIQGDRSLARAATEAIKQWQWEPTYLNGVRVPVLFTVTISFQLSGH